MTCQTRISSEVGQGASADSQPLSVTVLEPSSTDSGERPVPVQILLGCLPPPLVPLIAYALLPLLLVPVQSTLDERGGVAVFTQVTLGDGVSGDRGFVLSVKGSVRVVGLGSAGGLFRCIGHDFYTKAGAV